MAIFFIINLSSFSTSYNFRVVCLYYTIMIPSWKIQIVRKIILLRTVCIFGQFCKLELVGAQPLHLAIARPFCRLKAPLGFSLLHFVSQTRIYPRECDCMKKINIIINIFIAVFIGVFIGHGVYTVWDFKTHPELYVVQSAPWYTSILIYGVLTIILLLICIVIKVIINHKSKQKWEIYDYSIGKLTKLQILSCSE